MTSTVETDLPAGSAAWQLPSFQVAVHAPRRHAHALVIPVINEGERIRRQLLLIREASLPVDVIVADGGSTDGSLDPAFTAAAGVRTVLTKTGPGKLSAQLRMAYAWCLREGYEGIVTIDGNGKDGVEAVADMVARLQQGDDYVQGSRYLPGGLAENTPLERTIANRCIHAPLLSLAGRHWFTDTTNGFRAYSARYLLDARVQPFRDVFQRYELLFYLTARAGQIGMKVGHVPVVRRYPQDGQVPTKISGAGSKLKVLGETVAAATGGFAPDDAHTARPGWHWPLLLMMLTVLPLALAAAASPRYSPDSWAYFELAKTVFADFYRFSHFRSYWSGSAYSASFPPLFPTAIAAVDQLLGTGARTGLYLAFLSFGAFALLSEQIGRRAFGVAWLGLGVALVLLLGPAMVLGEMMGGRAIPLQLVLFAAVLLRLVQVDRMTWAGAAALGAVSGLAVLNRFDAIFLPVLAACSVWMLTRRLALAMIVALTAAVVVSPWIGYSLRTFGIAFATDNAGIAGSIDPQAFVTDWWPAVRPTWADEPAAWADRVGGHAFKLSAALVRVASTSMGATVAVALAVWAIAHYFVRLAQPEQSDRHALRRGLKALAMFTGISLLLLAPQVLTGYDDARYFTLLAWSGFLLAGGWAVTHGRTAQQRQVFASGLCVVMALPVILSAWLAPARIAAAWPLDAEQWHAFESPADVSSLVDCVRNHRQARILVIGDNTAAARAGAIAGLHTMMEPQNMADGRLNATGSQAFLTRWQVSHVLVADPARLSFAENTFHLTPVTGCPLRLFRVGA